MAWDNWIAFEEVTTIFLSLSAGRSELSDANGQYCDAGLE